MKIQESAENYLEAILLLKKKNGKVRSIDIARHMSFSKPSVSRAVNLLAGSGHVEIDGEGWIELTASGLEVATNIYERHRIIRDWLVRLGVDEEVASDDACKIEHDLSPETFEKLKAHIASLP